MPLVLISLLVFFTYGFSQEGKELFIKYNCSSCHAPDRRVVGPSFLEISKRYGTSEKAIKKVARLIIKPRPENWPGMAYMPPFNIPMEEAIALARYVLIESQKEGKKEEEKMFIENILEDELMFH